MTTGRFRDEPHPRSVVSTDACRGLEVNTGVVTAHRPISLIAAIAAVILLSSGGTVFAQRILVVISRDR